MSLGRALRDNIYSEDARREEEKTKERAKEEAKRLYRRKRIIEFFQDAKKSIADQISEGSDNPTVRCPVHLIGYFRAVHIGYIPENRRGDREFFEDYANIDLWQAMQEWGLNEDLYIDLVKPGSGQFVADVFFEIVASPACTTHLPDWMRPAC